jgi:hypothetical protein
VNAAPTGHPLDNGPSALPWAYVSIVWSAMRFLSGYSAGEREPARVDGSSWW